MNRKKVLIVEDNELNRAMLCEIVSEYYRPLEAENGQAALDILTQGAEGIALILLDLMMPVMDGYTFLDHIKQDPELSLIPVIVMTQGDSEEDEIASLAHGATDFVPKPYRPKVILHRMASLITLRENAAMINQFQYDRLTGLYSKEYFYQLAWDMIEDNPEKDYYILCSNIENFKLINDALGAQAGDALLREAAACARSVVGNDGLMGRLGDDHFVYLVEREKLEERRELIEESLLHVFDATKQSITIRGGVYRVRDHLTSVEKMCDRALLAARSIKGQYNRPYALYDESLRDKLLRERSITEAMEMAVVQKQFVVYYQPKYSLRSGAMVGAEALVRWIHPTWGFVSPGEFIPLFEKNGFIARLDRYVWEQVCAQLRHWEDMGYPSIPVSVNMSRADFFQNDLADFLSGLVEQYRIKPAQLHLELTESAYVDNAVRIISRVEELRQRGFVIEMDDFGSGYSSLNLLSQLRPDILKLDMQFIRSETAKPAQGSILNDVINMAHRMRLTVVAEGVENRAQLERLKSEQCDMVQGAYFSMPIPVPAFEAMLTLQQPSREVPAAMPTSPDRAAYTLLVVDEDANFRGKLRTAFQEECHVLEAADADSALACIRSDTDILTVVLSLSLANNGASTLIKALRQNPAFWQVPVMAVMPGGCNTESYPLAQEVDDCMCKFHPTFDVYRRIKQLLVTAISNRREQLLEDVANQDYLTGLLNRRGLTEALKSIHQADEPLAVYLFDLDDLKLINDTNGHSEGDRMIRCFAELLRARTRTGDILCRYGGDEFLVILKRVSQETTAVSKGESICAAFSEGYQTKYGAVSCTAGVTLCTSYELALEHVIDRADKALYHAKQECKGHCVVWQMQAEDLTARDIG
ncbi:MAG: EAL domain-containing protein [Aristaeellaceae bacterium]